MRNWTIKFISLLVFCMAVFCPFYAEAATPIDTAADASLTLYYQKEDRVFSGLEIGIYRVAEAFPNGTFELIAPFSSYPVNIHGITHQEQWKNTANTLSAYITADKIKPYKEGKTEEKGMVAFENLETGLYLVTEEIVEDSSGTYIFDCFLVYLPTPLQDGSYNYSVKAKPKCTSYVPKNEYRVTKLWQDTGNQINRPKEITIDIYKDGELFETQTLGADNNWSYVWYVPVDDHSKWTVVERDVAEEYTVTIQQNGSSFTIVNTHESNIDPDPPSTGYTTAMLPWIVTMCFSGMMLLIIGTHLRRRV